MLFIYSVLLCLMVVNAKPYHGYEQPDYTLDPNQPSDNSYEVRRYPSANWTTIKMEGMEMESSDAFMTLFDYIRGDNQEGADISMTVPVTIKFVSQLCIFCNHSYYMSFYLPKAFQSSPPRPNNPKLVTETRRNILAYVRTFPGYAKEGDYQKNVAQLHADLTRNGIADSSLITNMFYGASYDSPFHFLARRNEVWIIARN